MNKINYKQFPILYIDDEKGNVVAFKSVFEEEFSIHTALSAEEGLEILKKHNISIVITDQKMGNEKMSGTDLLKVLCEKYPKITRIILTAYREFDIILDAINDCKICKYLLKPWKPEVLEIEIKTIISRKMCEDTQNILNKIKGKNTFL